MSVKKEQNSSSSEVLTYVTSSLNNQIVKHINQIEMFNEIVAKIKICEYDTDIIKILRELYIKGIHDGIKIQNKVKNI